MNHSGFKFNIDVRGNGFLSYSWTAGVEEDGFPTPIAEGKAHGFDSGKKATVRQARKWAKSRLAHPNDKERWAECTTMNNGKSRHRRNR